MKYHKITPDIHGKTSPMPGMGGPEPKDHMLPVPFGMGKNALKWVRDMRRLPCHYCGRQAQTIDHKIPRSKGGKTTRSNCVPSCIPCNNLKGDTDYDEFVKRKKEKP